MPALFNNSMLKNIAKAAADKVGEVVSDPEVKAKLGNLGETGLKTIKNAAVAGIDAGINILHKAEEKVSELDVDEIRSTISEGAKNVKETSKKVAEEAGNEITKLKNKLEEEKKDIEEKGFSESAYNTTTQLINKASSLPIIQVNREEFLRKTFGSSPYIEQIIQYGPPAVYTVESLQKKCEDIIKNSTRKTTAASFLSGLPSNIALAIATGGLDIVQFFGFALNMAQKIAYIYGEDEIFRSYNPSGDMVDKGGSALPEDAQIRLISYLGAMMGVSGAGGIILKTSQTAGINIGKKVAAQALTKTTWYPVLKKVGSILGYKVTKKTVESAITKTVPVVGGVISGGLTFATFKPMGNRLSEVFVKIKNGEYDIEMELNPEFAKTLGTTKDDLEEGFDIIDGVFEDIEV